MKTNTYGFNRDSKAKVYVNPDGTPTWIDYYKLAQPISMSIKMQGESNGQFKILNMDWSNTLYELSDRTSLDQFENIVSNIEISGLNVVNVFRYSNNILPFVRYNSVSHVLTFFCAEDDTLDGATIGNDTYLKIYNSGWPWEDIRADIQKVVFEDPIYLFETDNGLSGMFSDMPELNSIENINNLITTNIKDMSSMFEGCSKLKTLDLSSFDTSAVEDMSSMFEGCENLEVLNISSFSYRVVTNTVNMFKNCSKLKTNIILDLNDYNPSSVKFSNMFENCSTEYGSFCFLYFSSNCEITREQISEIQTDLQDMYSTSDIRVSGYHDPIYPKSKTISITLDKLLDGNNCIAMSVIPGEDIEISNISVPLRFYRGLILHMDNGNIYSSEFQDTRIQLYVDIGYDNVYFSRYFSDVIRSKDLKIQIKSGLGK